MMTTARARKIVAEGVLLLLCCTAGQAYGQDPVTAEPPQYDRTFRKGAMVQAKIYSRMGMVEQSVDLYRKLRIIYPDDVNIWRNYIWVLVDADLHDAALAEVRQLLLKYPENVKAKKILATIYYEQGYHSRTFNLYEDALRVNPADVGAWRGYARSRGAAGDWAGSLICWQKVVELDDTQEAAGRSIRSILRKHRPQMSAGYRYHSSDSTSSIQTATLYYRRHLTPPTLLEFAYLRQDIREDGTDGEEDFSSEVHLPALMLHYQPPGKWEARAGVGYYTGIGESETYSLEVERQLGQQRAGLLRATVRYHRPWIDSVSAARYDGYLHQALLSFRWRSSYSLEWRFSAEHQTRFILDDLEYGQRRRFTAGIFKRLSAKPYLSIGYRIKYTDGEYEDKDFTPISLTESETIHYIPISAEVEVNEALRVSGTASVGHDFEVSTTYLSAAASLKVWLSERVDLDVGFNYSNDQTTLGADDGFTVKTLLTIIL